MKRVVQVLSHPAWTGVGTIVGIIGVVLTLQASRPQLPVSTSVTPPKTVDVVPDPNNQLAVKPPASQDGAVGIVDTSLNSLDENYKGMSQIRQEARDRFLLYLFGGIGIVIGVGSWILHYWPKEKLKRLPG
jgi:hypothetical protein